MCKKTIELDVSDLRAMLNKELKNNRKSALKLRDKEHYKDHWYFLHYSSYYTFINNFNNENKSK